MKSPASASKTSRRRILIRPVALHGQFTLYRGEHGIGVGVEGETVYYSRSDALTLCARGGEAGASETAAV
jgi:hypothetical protein